MVRALARFHVPAEFARGKGSSWTFAVPIEDTPRGLAYSSWQQNQYEREPIEVTARWRFLSIEGSPAILDLEHVDPVADDAFGAARILKAFFALAADGFPVAGSSWYGEIPRDPRTENMGLEIRASLVREESEADRLAPSIDRLLDDAVRELVAGLPPPGEKPWKPDIGEAPRRTLPKFPVVVRTDTVGDVIEVLSAVASHQREEDYFELFRHLAELATGDSALRDRLFQIAEGGDDPALRKLALYALGMTELHEVRIKLLDHAEDEELDLEFRKNAIEAVYLRFRDGPSWISGEYLPAPRPVDDREVLDRVIGLSRRPGLSRELLRPVLAGLSETQQSFPQTGDNGASRRLREMFGESEDSELRGNLVGSLCLFPSLSNVEFLKEIYRTQGGSKIARSIAHYLTPSGAGPEAVRDSLNTVLLDLAAQAATREDLVGFMRNFAVTPSNGERILDLARAGFLRPLQPGEDATLVAMAQRELLTEIRVKFQLNPRFWSRAREVLVGIRSETGGDGSPWAGAIDREIAEMDGTRERHAGAGGGG